MRRQFFKRWQYCLKAELVLKGCLCAYQQMKRKDLVQDKAQENQDRPTLEEREIIPHIFATRWLNFVRKTRNNISSTRTMLIWWHPEINKQLFYKWKCSVVLMSNIHHLQMLDCSSRQMKLTSIFFFFHDSFQILWRR